MFHSIIVVLERPGEDIDVHVADIVLNVAVWSMPGWGWGGGVFMGGVNF